MLFQLLIFLGNVLLHFSSHLIFYTMRMDPVLVALAFHNATEVDWFSSGGQDSFLAYYFAIGTVQEYAAERLVPVRIQQVIDGPDAPVSAPAVHVKWLPGIKLVTTSDTERYCRRYRALLDDDYKIPADAIAIFSATLIKYSRKSCLRKLKVLLSLQPAIVRLFSKLECTFQKQFPLFKKQDISVFYEHA